MSKPSRRCALYTRKSTEDGLDQTFNSLDAQREACAAYVLSQSGEGWKALQTRYDDGGFSGGSMERPALKRLLADIDAGGIDVVVVYKIDRLTRSLADFARIVERFDRRGVSFVSVTQAFNTTSSMGRLTLNVLLSFAQFERDVTGERIRDKIAASKCRGLWMGGTVPLGYDLPEPGSRVLKVNPVEAQTVRTIFETYLALGSVHALARHLRGMGVRSKRRVTKKGRTIGGDPLGRGALFHLLRNVTYRGIIVHKGAHHPGQHHAIVEADLFDAVQDMLNAQVRRHKNSGGRVITAPLAGRLFDAAGSPMSPTSSHGRGGRIYRYYVSSPLQRGEPPHDGEIQRISANALEDRLAEVLQRACKIDASPLCLPRRIEIHRGELHILLPLAELLTVGTRLAAAERVLPDPVDPAALRLIVPLGIGRRRSQAFVVRGRPPSRRPDAVLIDALQRAHAMVARDAGGHPVLTAAPTSSYRRRLVRLAFLAPDLQRAILAGEQSPALTLTRLLADDIPLSWTAQRQRYGTSSQIPR